MNADQLLTRLRALSSPAGAAVAQRYFKTGPGEYGEGDTFLGIGVPKLRRLAREANLQMPVPLPTVGELISSHFHEARSLALMILVERHRQSTPAEREAYFKFYLARHDRINKWDLVDGGASTLVGGWLIGKPAKDRRILDRLASSKLVWERRTAIVATYCFIKQDKFADTLRIAQKLLRDKHDLIHKASGWMLREVGKRDVKVLEDFLRQHHARMPRTMLRYAIERFPERRRKAYLKGQVDKCG